MIVTQDRLLKIMINYINSTSQFHQLKPIWTKSPIRVQDKPRIFNFSQIPKLIKLTNKDHVNNIIGKKPNDQFQKIWPKSSKPPNMDRFEIPKLKCMKCENKSKKKGKRVLPIFGERNLAKRMIKNDKNLRWSQVRIEEREIKA